MKPITERLERWFFVWKEEFNVKRMAILTTIVLGSGITFFYLVSPETNAWLSTIEIKEGTLETHLLTLGLLFLFSIVSVGFIAGGFFLGMIVVGYLFLWIISRGLKIIRERDK